MKITAQTGENLETWWFSESFLDAHLTLVHNIHKYPGDEISFAAIATSWMLSYPKYDVTFLKTNIIHNLADQIQIWLPNNYRYENVMQLVQENWLHPPPSRVKSCLFISIGSEAFMHSSLIIDVHFLIPSSTVFNAALN